jgi:hypothetical protein
MEDMVLENMPVFLPEIRWRKSENFLSRYENHRPFSCAFANQFTT